MAKKEFINQVYNAGIARFLAKAEPKRDKYGTPLRGQTIYVEAMKAWYRKLGITAQDVYYSHADDTQLNRKIAIFGDVDIDTKWRVELGDKHYEVYRCFYSYKHNETEISLREVASE
ncbi:phage head closure protein [Hutsoniella sourekii]|uniref:phage head closure protein n=1 Tax=Hutsoniella sourekii TaxID=87650 RepID=UPI0004B234D6|nr:phage head closure protein [Hutsoniella sourekii]